MTNSEAVNWIINISADIGKAEHRDLWHYEQALSEIREMLESAQSEPQWIPCREKLPEENGEYLVTREAKGIYKYVDIVKKTNTSGDIASDIIAWMPLPKSYREEGEK